MFFGELTPHKTLNYHISLITYIKAHAGIREGVVKYNVSVLCHVQESDIHLSSRHMGVTSCPSHSSCSRVWKRSLCPVSD